MRWQDGFRLTSSALTCRPLRSLLTLLGVAIGIAAVALLTAVSGVYYVQLGFRLIPENGLNGQNGGHGQGGARKG